MKLWWKYSLVLVVEALVGLDACGAKAGGSEAVQTADAELWKVVLQASVCNLARSCPSCREDREEELFVFLTTDKKKSDGAFVVLGRTDVDCANFVVPVRAVSYPEIREMVSEREKVTGIDIVVQKHADTLEVWGFWSSYGRDRKWRSLLCGSISYLCDKEHDGWHCASKKGHRGKTAP